MVFSLIVFSAPNNVQNELIETQIIGFTKNHGNLTPGEKNQRHFQITERNMADKDKKEVHSIAAAVENLVHDWIMTAMDSIGMPGVEMAVKPISISWR